MRLRRLLTILVTTFTTFSVFSQISTTGTATADGNDCYTLTQNINASVGSIWEQTAIDLNQDQIWEVNLNFGCNDSNGADGIVFIMHSVPNVTGASGGTIGYNGINPSIAIEFDTWQNADRQDPTFDHLGLMVDGDGFHSTGDLVGPIQISPTSANVEDCNDHPTIIEWDATLQEISVTFDCDVRFTHQIDIINTIFGGNPNVYWGFIATTGGATNIQTVCFASFPPPPPLNLQDGTICVGDNYQLNAPGGYVTYQWSPTTGLSNPTIPNPIANPSVTTTYVLTVTDDCGNTFTDDMTLTVINPPTPITNDANYSICPNDQVALVAPPGFLNYQWNPTSYLNASNLQVVLANPPVDITYTVTFEDECGNMYEMDHIIDVDEIIPPSPLPDEEFCFGDTLILQAPTGYFFYQWTNLTTQAVTPGQVIVVIPDAPTNYEISFEDLCNNVFLDTIELFTNSTPPPPLNLQNATICPGDFFQLNAPSGYVAYQWTPTTGLSNPTIPNPIANPSVTTTYVLTTTDDCGNTYTDDMTLTINTPPVPNTDDVNYTTCPNNSVTLIAPTGYLNYQWTPTTYLNTSNAPAVLATPPDNITYTVSFEDECGTIYEMDHIVVVLSTGQPPIPIPDEGFCIGDTVNLQAPDGYFFYQWTDLSTQITTLGQTISVIPDDLASYEASYSDICNNTYLDTVALIPGISEEIDDFLTDTIVCGSVTLDFSADPDFMDYEWLDASGTVIGNSINIFVSPDISTFYLYTATDNCNSLISDTVHVEVTQPAVLDIIQEDYEICSGEVIIIQTDTAFIQINWLEGIPLDTLPNGQYSLSPSQASTYILQYTDACAQTALDTFEIDVNLAETLDVFIPDTTLCLGEDVTVTSDLDFAGVIWLEGSEISDNGDQTYTLAPITTDLYVLSYTSECGITFLDSFEVNITQPEVVDILLKDTTLCLGDVATVYTDPDFESLNWTPNTGVTPNGGGSYSLSPPISTTYILSYTDSCGFLAGDTMNVTIIQPTILQETQENYFICTGEEVQITPDQGFSQYTILPNNEVTTNPDGTLNIAPTASTTFIIEYTDECALVVQDTFEIAVVDEIPLNILQDDQNICLGDSLIIQADFNFSGISFNPSDIVQDLGNAQFLIIPDSTSSVIITYNDACGFEKLDSFQINISEPTALDIFQNDEIICLNEQVLILVDTDFEQITFNPMDGVEDLGGGQYELTPTADIVYQIEYADACGFVASDTFGIQVAQPVELQVFQNDEIICFGETLQIQTAAGFTQIDWTPNTGVVQTGSTSYEITANQNTSYQVTYTDACGFTQTDAFNLNVVEAEVLDVFLPDEEFCAGENVIVNTDTDFDNVVWTPTTGVTNLGGGQYELAPLTDISYQLTYTDVCGFTAQDNLDITVIQAVEPAFLMDDIGVCQNGQSPLLASPGFVSYNWTPSIGLSDASIFNPIATITEDTWYSVEMTDLCGNVVIDDVLLQFLDSPLDFGSDQFICDETEITLSAPITGIEYLWSTGAITSSIDVIADGNYALTITTDPYCEWWDNVGIAFGQSPPQPVLDLEINYCIGDSVLLDPNLSALEDYLIEWNTGELSPQIWATESGYYEVLTETDCGIRTDGLSLFFEDCTLIYIPNIFTPNNDGINDYFELYSPNIEQINTFEIFDRWGGKVFDAKDFGGDVDFPKWDGRMQDALCVPDAYTWYAQITFKNGTVKFMKGSVTLMQ